MNKKLLFFLPVITISLILFVIYVKNNSKTLDKNIGKPIGEYTLKEETKGQAADKTCKYTATYKGKTISLGEYKVVDNCHTTQTVVANGMLAIAAAAYTFIYDPQKDEVVTLDPNNIIEFKSFTVNNTISLSDYPQRRYFINNDNWQIIYQKEAQGTVSAALSRLTFTTVDAGKTFTFDTKEK